VEVEPPLTLALCCLDEVAAPVGQDWLASGGAGGRGLAAGGGDRLNAGASGRSPGSETAGRRSRSAGDGNAGGAGVWAGSGLRGGFTVALTVPVAIAIAVAVAGGLGLGSTLEKRNVNF
jgi:hypothetical protein